MSDFEKMYTMFNLDNDQVEHLKQLASKSYPFSESENAVAIKTLILNGSEEVRKEEGVVDAKLV